MTYFGRSLTGAWIETYIKLARDAEGVVAPLRGRGLKLYVQAVALH